MTDITRLAWDSSDFLKYTLDEVAGRVLPKLTDGRDRRCLAYARRTTTDEDPRLHWLQPKRTLLGRDPQLGAVIRDVYCFAWDYLGPAGFRDTAVVDVRCHLVGRIHGDHTVCDLHRRDFEYFEDFEF